MQSRGMRPLALVSQTAHSEEPPTTSVGFGVYVQISMRCCRRVRGVETLQWETTSMTIGWRTGDRFQQSTGHKLRWGKKKIHHVGRFLAETGVQCPARPAPCVCVLRSVHLYDVCRSNTKTRFHRGRQSAHGCEILHWPSGAFHSAAQGGK